MPQASKKYRADFWFRINKVNAPISQRTRFVPIHMKDEVRKTLAFVSSNNNTILHNSQIRGSRRRNINTLGTDHRNSERSCAEDNESSLIILDTTSGISGLNGNRTEVLDLHHVLKKSISNLNKYEQTKR